MQSYYLLSLLCLTFCAVAKCAITTGLDCQAEKYVEETKNLATNETTNVYYCPDGAPANYDEQSARHHCCTVPLRQGKCPGECRKLRSKRSMGVQTRMLSRFFSDESDSSSEEGPKPFQPIPPWPWKVPPPERRPNI